MVLTPVLAVFALPGVFIKRRSLISATRKKVTNLLSEAHHQYGPARPPGLAGSASVPKADTGDLVKVQSEETAPGT